MVSILERSSRDSRTCLVVQTKRAARHIFLAVALLATPGLSCANGGYMTAFDTLYGGGFSCSVCHTSAPATNAYGSDFFAAGNFDGANITNPTNALVSIQDLDSDKDCATNIVEINAIKLPGDSSSRADVQCRITPTVFFDDNSINGNCTLREAIIATNTNTPVDECPSGTSRVDDRIDLRAGTYTLSVAGAGENLSASGDLDIRGHLELHGEPAATLGAPAASIIDANDLDRALDVGFGDKLIKLFDLTIQNGNAVTVGSDDGSGGGIRIKAITDVRSTSVSRVVVRNSQAETNGGGVSVDSTGLGLMTFQSLSLLSNNAGGLGGGLYIAPTSNTRISDAMLLDNNATGSGGGIASQATTYIYRGSVAGNNALGAGASGGGIWHTAYLEAENLTVSGNTSTTGADGVHRAGSNTTYLNASTVTNHDAGIYSDTDNGVRLQGTIVWGNAMGCTGGGGTESFGSNMVDSSCSLTCGAGSCFSTPDRTGVDPMLLPLRTFRPDSGPTKLHPLSILSPAIDSNVDCFSNLNPPMDNDQRNQTRPADGDGDLTATCDVGAFELQPGENFANTPNDFNGDAKSDVLWRNGTTGGTSMWFVNGLSITGSASLGRVPSDWIVAGTGDFDNNGTSDILWRNQVTGRANIWLLDNGAVVGNGNLGVIGTNFVVAGVGDFNGDGRDDILWRNGTTGGASMWFVNGLSITGSAPLGTVPISNWIVAGTGDFDNDGTSDILWRNQATGRANIWLLDNGVVVGNGNLGVIGTNFVVAGVGDFNGDGPDDILWRNGTTGGTSMWFVNGLSITGSAPLGTVPIFWTVATTGDYNGDANSDVVWRNQVTGKANIWLLENGAVTANGNLGVISTDFNIVP